MPSFTATAKKDIVIKDIYMKNKSDGKSLNHVDIDLSKGNNKSNVVWEKGKDIIIQKGSKLNFNFEIKNTQFEENLNCTSIAYMYIEYEVDGKRYIEYNQASYETNYDSQVLYAMYKDKVDFRPYFEANY